MLYSNLQSGIVPVMKKTDCQKTYLLTFAFNGTEYAGWQYQPGMKTVQETMETTLRHLYHDPAIVLTGCGRTDAGVHAVGMTASFETVHQEEPEELKRLLNLRLPHDIRIIAVQIFPSGFKANAVTGKVYVYAVNIGYDNLFLKKACWSWAEITPENLADVRKAIRYLEGTHIFRNFTGRKDKTSGKPRTIYRAEMIEYGPVICFYFSGSGFLHKMIRRIVGALHCIAAGELTVDEFAKAVHDPDVSIGDAVAPARGLYLKRVFYSQDEWQQDRLEHPPFYQ